MKTKLHINAQFLYVIAIAWLVAATGCFLRHVGMIGLIFSAVGTIHLVAAVVVDVKESKK